MIKEHAQHVLLAMRLFDLAVTAATWWLCFQVRFHSGWFSVIPPVPHLGAVADILVVILLLSVIVFEWMGLYRARRTQMMAGEAWAVLRACLAVWILEIVIAHFLHSSPISRKLQGMFLIAWPTAMVAYRGAARLALRFLRKRGHNLRSVAIVGAGRNAQKLLHTLDHLRWTGQRVQYFVDDARAGGHLLDRPVRGPILDADRILREHPVDVVYVALPKHKRDLLEPVMARLSTLLVDINVVPDVMGHLLLRHQISTVGHLPMVNLTQSPQEGVEGLIKRVIDVLGSLVLLVLLSPVMIAVAVAVKLSSPGPALYRQRRTSVGGHAFTILKFRSMLPNAEARTGAAWGVDGDDPRLTRVGRFLRKYSLDELPQLINVLIGDMSLVGPRPERPEFIERFTKQFPRYVLRHHVKAGLTGWAQVNGLRGRTSLRKRLQYDLDYINRWSLWFDIRILLLTLVRGVVNPSE